MGQAALIAITWGLVPPLNSDFNSTGSTASKNMSGPKNQYRFEYDGNFFNPGLTRTEDARIAKAAHPTDPVARAKFEVGSREIWRDVNANNIDFL